MNHSKALISLYDPFNPKRCSRSPSPQSLSASTRKRKGTDTKRHFDSGLETLNENASLHRESDTKTRWRRASNMQESRESRKDMNDVFLLCPDHSCRPFEMLIGEDESSQDPLDSQCPEQASTGSPTTFRELSTQAHDSKGNSSNSFSPTSSVHFWQRSLAWSDDEEEDDESCDGNSTKEDIWQELSFPKMLGKEYANRVDLHQKEPERRHRPLRRPRRKILQHQPAVSLDIFRAPDPVDHTSEIFWEEKVFSVDDLEKMANLTIGGK
jgi:hypothetical protein